MKIAMKNFCNKLISTVRVEVDNFQICERLVMYDSLLQLCLILANVVIRNEYVNKVLFVNLYIVIGLMLISFILKGIARHFLIFSFIGCFFVFLMGQKPFMKEYNVFLTFARTELDCRQYLTFSAIMSLGLIVMYFTYLLIEIKENKNYGRWIEKKISKEKCKKYIRALFFMTFPLAFYMQLKIVIVRSRIPYTEGYLMNVELPVIVKIGYYLFVNFLIMYLAIKPSKKQLSPILLIFLFLEGGIQLLQGRRALFATSLLFVVWYLLKYYNVKWIRYRYLLIGAIGGCALIILFFGIEQMRGDEISNSLNIFEMIKSFMISTGGSDSVIANTIVRKNMFPKAKILYIINPIIFNPITLILTGKMGIAQGTEQLNSFNNFSHWLSFLTEPSLYESGHGMGSAYLAEAYFVGGIVGVVFVSVILGLLLRIMSNISFEDNFIVVSVVFILVQNLFTLPRGSLFEWFSRFTYLMISATLLYMIKIVAEKLKREK